ncbi:MAG: proton-conducting transporter membrane subunit, partial [Candidatus Manganitrophaceae bacterium]
MTNVFGFPILSLIAYIPLAGCIILLFINKDDHKKIMQTAFGVTIVDMLVSFLLLPGFDSSTAEMQFVEKASWIPSLGVEYHFGIDGISLLLILMTTILSAIAVVSSFTAIHERVKEYYVSLLFLQAGMLGVFMAVDLFLFYIFWEIMLVPMYFLIGIWGGGRRLYSAIKFFLYTLFGSLFMLLGILTLYFLNHDPAYGSGQFTFNLLELYKMKGLDLGLEKLLFLSF